MQNVLVADSHVGDARLCVTGSVVRWSWTRADDCGCHQFAAGPRRVAVGGQRPEDIPSQVPPHLLGPPGRFCPKRPAQHHPVGGRGLLLCSMLNLALATQMLRVDRCKHSLALSRYSPLKRFCGPCCDGVVIRVVQGCEYLESRNVVHRALQTRRIMVGASYHEVRPRTCVQRVKDSGWVSPRDFVCPSTRTPNRIDPPSP